MDTNPPPSITVAADKQVPAVLPSLASRIRLAIAYTSRKSEDTFTWGALLVAACAPGQGLPEVKRKSDLLDVGDTALEALHARGVPLQTIRADAEALYLLMAKDVRFTNEVKEAEDFSSAAEPEKGGSAAAGRSIAGGDSNPDGAPATPDAPS